MSDTNRSALFEQAVAAHRSGALQAARDTCAQLLGSHPLDVPAMALMALIAADLGEIDEGLAWAARALDAEPRDAMAHFALGRLREAQERLADAEASYRAALECDPNLAKAHNNLGAVLHLQGRREEAVASYRRAVELDALLPEANLNYAALTRDRPAFERALEGLRARLGTGSTDAATYLGMAGIHRELAQDEQALECYERALGIDADLAEARFGRAEILLKRGEYASGWKEFEWRLRLPHRAEASRRFDQPMWDGRETAHAVLLHAEGGFSDTLQFVRYASLVAPRCGSLILECQPELKLLLLAMRDAPRVIARGDPVPPFDVHAPLLSLPALLGTTLETIPWPGPYLRPPAEQLAKWRAAVQKRRVTINVGLAWAGRSQYWDDRSRSVSVAQLAPLALPGVAFFSLQVGPAGTEAAAPPPRMQLYDPTAKIKSFADTAALASFMDLVISIDTSVAHLAGGLGIPTWVLVPFPSDWRHPVGGEDNPWYPTMRLFRQSPDGDWSAAIRAMAAELARLAASKTRS